MKYFVLMVWTIFYTGLLHADPTQKSFQYARLMSCAEAIGLEVNGANPFYVLTPSNDKDENGKFGTIHFYTPFGSIRIPFNFAEADGGKASFIIKLPGKAAKKIAHISWTPETEYEDLAVTFEDYKDGVDARDFSSQKPKIEENSNNVLAYTVGDHLITKTAEVASTFDFSAVRSGFGAADFQDVLTNEQKRTELNTKLKNQFALSIEAVLQANSKSLEDFRQSIVKACNGDKNNQSLHNIALVKYVLAQQIINEVQKINGEIPKAVKDSVMSTIDQNLFLNLDLSKYSRSEGILNRVEGYVTATIGNERQVWKPKEEPIASEPDSSIIGSGIRRPAVKVPAESH